jgi:hypothetical protein
VGIFCPGGGTCLTTAFDGKPESTAFGNFASEPFHPKDRIIGSTSAQYIPRTPGMTNIVVGGLDGMAEAGVVDGAAVAVLLVVPLDDWWFDPHAALTSTATVIVTASSALRIPAR